MPFLIHPLLFQEREEYEKRMASLKEEMEKREQEVENEKVCAFKKRQRGGSRRLKRCAIGSVRFSNTWGLLALKSRKHSN